MHLAVGVTGSEQAPQLRSALVVEAFRGEREQFAAPVAWHTTGYTNGPAEGLNSLIKKVKRVAAGFRSFTNYRLRILLAVGDCNWNLLGTHPH